MHHGTLKLGIVMHHGTLKLGIVMHHGTQDQSLYVEFPATVNFEVYIYRNSNEEWILRLIYKKRLSYYNIKEKHILRLIYSKIKEEQI